MPVGLTSQGLLAAAVAFARRTLHAPPLGRHGPHTLSATAIGAGTGNTVTAAGMLLPSRPGGRLTLVASCSGWGGPCHSMSTAVVIQLVVYVGHVSLGTSAGVQLVRR